MAADFVVKKMSADEANWFRQNSYLMGQWDYNHGLERAEERGERNAKLEAAKNLLKMNLDNYEQIAQVMGIPCRYPTPLSHSLPKQAKLMQR